jgi:hypothetical protein
MRKNKPVKLRQRYAVLVDGECEYWYIQMLKRNERQISVNIEPKIPQKKSLSEQYSKICELSLDYDIVFWIIDFDVILSETAAKKSTENTVLSEFKKYYNRIENDYKNVKVIINNPCFEFWLLLHFKFTSKIFNNCGKVIDELKSIKYMQDYSKSKRYYTKQANDIYLKLKPYLLTAITNTNKFDDFDFANCFKSISQMQLFFKIDEININLKL